MQVNSLVAHQHSQIVSPSRINIIKSKTEIHELNQLEKVWGRKGLMIKREDQTSQGYGGNKVRNLEYIIGTAISMKKKRLVTAAPVGSNFSAALSYHAKNLGLEVSIHQFVPETSPQIVQHNRFIKGQNSQLKTYHRAGLHLSAINAYLSARMESVSRQDSFFISPGGSNLMGAYGHWRALKEMKDDGVEPDFLVVGVGTCGTIAGILAAIKEFGLKTKVIGVRCVNPIVCHKIRICQIANSLLRSRGVSQKVSLSDFLLQDPIGSALKYGRPDDSFMMLKDQFYETEGVLLDTTYTSKVVSQFQKLALDSAFRKKSILYWHTYSSRLG